MIVRTYKMMVDSGFAPNPFEPTLTLANCKPSIRRTHEPGDWLAGFTSKGLVGDEVGSERLVYLMRVSEKIRFRDYFHDPRFEDKIPDLDASNRTAQLGDNIYCPLCPDAELPEEFDQLPNLQHDERNHALDVNGKYVLIADEFYYFGRKAVALPDHIRPNVPRNQAAYGIKTESPRAEQFVDYIRSNFAVGRHGKPHYWIDETDPIRQEDRDTATNNIEAHGPRLSTRSCGGSPHVTPTPRCAARPTEPPKKLRRAPRC